MIDFNLLIIEKIEIKLNYFFSIKLLEEFYVLQ